MKSRKTWVRALGFMSALMLISGMTVPHVMAEDDDKKTKMLEDFSNKNAYVQFVDSSANPMAETDLESAYSLNGTYSLCIKPTEWYKRSTDVTLEQDKFFEGAAGYAGIVMRMSVFNPLLAVNLKIGIKAENGNTVWLNTKSGVEFISLKGKNEDQAPATSTCVAMPGSFNGFVVIPFGLGLPDTSKKFKLVFCLANGDWDDSAILIDQIACYKPDSDMGEIIKELGYTHFQMQNRLLDSSTGVEILDLDPSINEFVPQKAYTKAVRTEASAQDQSEIKKLLVGEPYDAMWNYDIRFTDNNGSAFNPPVDLGGNAIITFPLPDGYTADDVRIFKKNENGGYDYLTAQDYSVTNSVMVISSSVGQYIVTFMTVKRVTISGRLVYTDYFPVAGMNIALDPGNMTARTDANGAFTIKNVKVGENTLNVLDSKGRTILTYTFTLTTFDDSDFGRGIINVADKNSIKLFFLTDRELMAVTDVGEEQYAAMLKSAGLTQASGQNTDTTETPTTTSGQESGTNTSVTTGGDDPNHLNGPSPGLGVGQVAVPAAVTLIIVASLTITLALYLKKRKPLSDDEKRRSV